MGNFSYLRPTLSNSLSQPYSFAFTQSFPLAFTQSFPIAFPLSHSKSFPLSDALQPRSEYRVPGASHLRRGI